MTTKNEHNDPQLKAFEEAAARIRKGRYPHPESDAWMLRDWDGVSIAHIAADRHLDIGFFPPSNPIWAEADSEGVTIAHKAMRLATMDSQPPAPDWMFWGLTDKHGWTVAHIAADNGLLLDFPPNWPHWATVGRTAPDPETGDQSTCRVIALQANSWRGINTEFPPTWEGWGWLIEDHGTVAHLFATRRVLPAMPDDWNGWTWKDTEDRTVADLTANEALSALEEMGGAIKQMLRRSLETSTVSTVDTFTYEDNAVTVKCKSNSRPSILANGRLAREKKATNKLVAIPNSLIQEIASLESGSSENARFVALLVVGLKAMKQLNISVDLRFKD